jgi:hypothetical protein
MLMGQGVTGRGEAFNSAEIISVDWIWSVKVLNCRTVALQ